MKAGYVMIAGLALLGAAATRTRRHASVPNPLDAEQLAARVPSFYVGRQGFEWPMIERFPEPLDFQKALARLGYVPPIDGKLLSVESKASVLAFQRDWNVVDRAFDMDAPVDGSGYIDAQTIEAIAAALDAQRSRNREWFDIVSEGISRLRPGIDS